MAAHLKMSVNQYIQHFISKETTSSEKSLINFQMLLLQSPEMTDIAQTSDFDFWKSLQQFRDETDLSLFEKDIFENLRDRGTERNEVIF